MSFVRCSLTKYWKSIDFVRTKCRLWSGCTVWFRSMLVAYTISFIYIPLRKHAYSNISKISPPKTESFQIKFWYFSYFCSKHRLCRGGSNEYPQFMFLSRNKKNNVYTCKPQFYYIKVGFTGSQNYIGMFSWCGPDHLLSLVSQPIISIENVTQLKCLAFWPFFKLPLLWSQTDQGQCWTNIS